MNKINDKVVVITGASSGIGRGTALAVAQQQGTVVLAARSRKALKEVARECEDAGGRVMFAPLDVTDLRSVEALARSAIDEFGRIDVWVNNAAVTLFARFEEAPEEAYEQVIETNVFGYMNGARAVLPYFREQGHGTLINVSSMVGKIGSPYVSAYTTSKFAINGWAESLRMELQDAPGIHVCTILAASIDTPLFEHAANYTGRAVKPMPPIYSPEMVVDSILRCMLKPRREIYVGKAGGVMAALRSIAPAFAEKSMARQVDRSHFQNQSDDETEGNVFAPDSRQRNSVDGGWGGKKAGSAARWLGLAALAGLGAAAYFWTEGGAPDPRAKRRVSKPKKMGHAAASRMRKIRDKLPVG